MLFDAVGQFEASLNTGSQDRDIVLRSLILCVFSLFVFSTLFIFFLLFIIVVVGVPIILHNIVKLIFFFLYTVCCCLDSW